MSMNFGREKMLLRQRLGAAATPARAAELQQRHGAAQSYLGADDEEVTAAAGDLAAAYPNMGRAQMTAFVRTLWQSKIHELRAVGAELLAARAALLEAPDLPFLEGLLTDDCAEPARQRLARDVLGPLVHRNKKLWKDLRRLAGHTNAAVRQAAALATAAPAADADGFARGEELWRTLLGDAEARVHAAVDEALKAAAAQQPEAAQAFAAALGRKLTLPKAKRSKPTQVAEKPVVVEAAKKATKTSKPATGAKTPKKPAAKGPAAKGSAAKKPATAKAKADPKPARRSRT